MKIFDAHISGSLSVSSSAEISNNLLVSGNLNVLGTINGSVSGNTTSADTASFAPKYTLTSSFQTFTSSYTTGSFTGSFIGSGTGLYGIPASGITGLNLSQIAEGSSTASISSTNGLRVNTNTEITGALTISGSISLNGVPVGTGKLDETTFNSYTSSNDSTNSTQSSRLTSIESATGSLNSFTNSIDTTIKNKLNTETVISGSVQVLITGTTGYSTFSSSISTSIGSLSGSVATTTSGLSSSIGSLSSGVDSLSSSIATTTSGLSSSIATTTSGLSSSIGSLSSSVATTTSGLSSSIVSLSSSVATTTSGLSSSLSSSIGSLSSSVATTTSGLSSSIVSLSSSVATTTSGLSSSIVSLSSSVATTTLNLKNRVDSIETSTGSLNSFTSSINTTIKSKLDGESVISGSIQVIITGTTGYSTFSSSIATTTSDLSSSIGSLSSSVATTTSGLSSSIGSLSSSVATTTSGLSSSVSSLSSSVATTTLGLSSSIVSLSSSVATTTSGLSSSVATTTLGLSSSIVSLSSSVATTTLGTKNRVDSIESKTGSYATTGSNIFQGNQTITGSLYVSQDLIIAGSSSIQHISSSIVNIADNIITVNASNPSLRFGGLAVIDSGSSPQVSGSILFDSIENQWIFIHQNQATVTSSMLIMGPETYDNVGNETHLTLNRLVKSLNDEHIGDSNITDTGTKVSINSDTEVTGTLKVTGNITNPNITAIESATGSLNTFTSSINTTIKSKLDSEGVISGSIQVNHNATTNYVANQHIDHTTVSITAGSGLTGGGDISTTRTINVGAGNGITVNADDIAIDTASATFTTGVKSKLNADGVVSGSSQIDGSLLGSNKTITIGSTSTTLGGTSTSLAGLTSVTSTAFTGSLQGNATNVTATSNTSLTSLSNLNTIGTITGGTWNGTAIGDSYISSATNWNTAYNKRISTLGFTSSTVTITLADATTVTVSVPTFNQNTSGTAANITASSNTSLTSLANLATVGTITTGVWNGSAIGNSYLANSSFNIGTTSISLGRASASQTLTGVAIDGNAGSVTNGVYTTGDQTIGGAKTFSSNITNSATADWYMYGFGSRGANSGQYGMGLGSDIANRTLSFHIPNVAAYSNTGATPKFGWYSNGASELMTLQSATGNLVVTGTINGLTVSSGTISSGTWNGTAIGDSYISSATNWNTAYNKRISSLGFTSSTVTITLADTTTVTASVPTFNQNTTGTAANITASSNTSLTSLANLATVGTITSGTWNGTSIGTTYTAAKVTAVNAGTGVGVDTTTGSVTVSIGQAVATSSSPTFTDLTLSGGFTVGGSLSRGTYVASSNYVTGADNIVLKGNSSGVSGIFFESEKDGTNINHPSDFAFIQYFPYGIGGSSGEANRLVIGTSNDADDMIVMNPVDINGLKLRAGVGTTDYTIYHSGNIPTWNQNTTGTAANITATSNTTLTSLANLATVGTITSGTWNGSTIGNAYLTNSSFYVGTTSISLGRASASQTLTGVSIDGNSATVTNATFYRQFTVRDDRSDGNDYSLIARATGLYAITSTGTNGPGSTYSSLIHVSNGTDVAFQIAGGYTSDNMYFRGTSALQSGSGYTAWRTVIHSGNIASQTVTYATGETLATVTNRGASTTGAITVNGALTGTSSVAASGGASGGFLSSTYSSGYNRIWAFGNATAYGLGYYQGGTDYIGFHFGATGSPQYIFYQTGNMSISGVFTENSSIRYKKDIETVKYGLDKVLQMRGVTYVKKDTGLKEIGVIAEEMNEIVPEVIIKNEEGLVDAVSYGRLSAVFIEAIKELKQEINEQNLIISELKSKLGI